MTKKDYITIANALKPYYQNSQEYNPEEWKIYLDIINDISKALKQDNPKFDPVKFLDYLRDNK